jgi:hypothetical protein
LDNQKVELDGKTLKGTELIKQMVKDIGEGNYRLYNMATGGIGKNHPMGNLLAKIGIE